MNTPLYPWGRRAASRALALFAASVLSGLLPLASTLAQDASDPKEDEEEEEIFVLSPFTVEAGPSVGYQATSTLAGSRLNTNLGDVGSAISGVSANMLADIGVTAGGAQDINLFRALVERDVVPPPEALTPEGLFSQHDLPIAGSAPEGWLFGLAAEARPFRSAAQPNVDYLAQIGFVSGINPAAFQPRPLNLVAVVDKSGSMNGEPLDLVRQSLRQLSQQLGSDDQLAIVLYGSSTHLHLPATRMTDEGRQASLGAIDAIESAGSTYMEAGLQLGFQQARQSAADFDGLTRVMLFTDERPNVGRTDADSFMGMATEASRDGIGLTTIGVGVHFGAELAARVSSVRGGNLFFFDDADTMDHTFRKELDTMVLELAYDLQLSVQPEPGVELAAVYGIPGDALHWNESGGLELSIATLFASRKKGAIFFGFRGAPERSRSALATARIAYLQADNGARRETTLPIALTPNDAQSLGLEKGSYLVDQYATFALAANLYRNGDYSEARRQLQRFAQRTVPRPELAPEQDLASAFAALVEGACHDVAPKGNASELSRRFPELLGDWIETTDASPKTLLRLLPNATVEAYQSSPENPMRYLGESTVALQDRQLVFADWGEIAPFRLGDGILELQQDGRWTRYERRPDAARPDLAALQREIGGLPPRP